MSDDEKPETGTSEGTHAGAAAGDRRPGDTIAADLKRVDQERDQAEGEQIDLLAGSLDIEDEDVLAAASELVAKPRRERGRPPGATNRRNSQMFDYLAQLGHRHPAVTLSMIQSADTLALANALATPLMLKGKPVRDGEGRIVYVGADPTKVLAIQRQAAADLLPYDLAKKPQALELPPDAKRPLMVIGEMNVIGHQQNNTLSVGDPRPKKANEINGRSVRHGENESHEDSQAIDDSHETDGEAPD